MATASNSFVMLALGDFRFGLNTAAYQELRRRNSWRWPAVDRIGARPASQFVGPGEDSVTMSGVVYPHFKGGLGQIAAMRAEADKGGPLMLVDGTGQVWGKYVITDLEEGQEVFFSNGAPRCQHFDLTLQAYGGEDASTLAPVDLSAVALPSLPVPSLESAIGAFTGVNPAAFAQTIASKAMMGLPNLRALAGMTTDGLASVTNAIQTVASVFGSVAGPVLGMQRAAAAVPGALDALFSSNGIAAFAASGLDLNALVATAVAGGTSGLDAALDAANSIGVGNIAPRLFTDADQVAAFTALAEVRADV